MPPAKKEKTPSTDQRGVLVYVTKVKRAEQCESQLPLSMTFIGDNLCHNLSYVRCGNCLKPVIKRVVQQHYATSICSTTSVSQTEVEAAAAQVADLYRRHGTWVVETMPGARDERNRPLDKVPKDVLDTIHEVHNPKFGTSKKRPREEAANDEDAAAVQESRSGTGSPDAATAITTTTSTQQHDATSTPPTVCATHADTNSAEKQYTPTIGSPTEDADTRLPLRRFDPPLPPPGATAAFPPPPQVVCYTTRFLHTVGVPFLLTSKQCGVWFKDTSCILCGTDSAVTYVNPRRHRFTLRPLSKDATVVVPKRLERKFLALLWCRDVFANEEKRGIFGFRCCECLPVLQSANTAPPTATTVLAEDLVDLNNFAAFCAQHDPPSVLRSTEGTNKKGSCILTIASEDTVPLPLYVSQVNVRRHTTDSSNDMSQPDQEEYCQFVISNRSKLYPSHTYYSSDNEA